MKAAALFAAVALALPDAIPPASRSLQPAHTGLLRTLVPPFNPTALDVSPDGQRVAVGGGGRFAIYSAASGRLLALSGLGDDVASLEFSPSGSMLMVVRVGGAVAVYGRGANVEVEWKERIPGPVRWARDGGSLWCSYSGELQRRLLRTGEIVQRVKTDREPLAWFRFSPDERQVLLNVPGDRARLLEAATGRERRIVDLTRDVWAFSPDGRRLALSGPGSAFLAGADGAESNTLEDSANLVRLAFTADGRQVVGVGPDESLRMWTADRGGKPAAVLTHHGGRVHDVAVSRNAALIVTCATDGLVKLWGRVPGGMTKVRPKGYIGVRLDTDAEGCVIVEVVPGHPGETAGLKAGDHLLAVQGQEIKTHTDVIRLVTAHLVGDEIEVDVKSAGTTRKARIRLGPRPESR